MSEDAGQVDYVAGRLEFLGHSPYRAICSEEIFKARHICLWKYQHIFISHTRYTREPVSNDIKRHFVHVCAYYINNIKYIN